MCACATSARPFRRLWSLTKWRSMGKHIKVMQGRLSSLLHGAAPLPVYQTLCVAFSLQWSQSGTSTATPSDSTEYTQGRRSLSWKAERPQGWRFVWLTNRLKYQFIWAKCGCDWILAHRTTLQPLFYWSIWNETFISCLTLRINKPFLILKCNWKNMWLVRVTMGCGKVLQFTALTAS